MGSSMRPKSLPALSLRAAKPSSQSLTPGDAEDAEGDQPRRVAGQHEGDGENRHQQRCAGWSGCWAGGAWAQFRAPRQVTAGMEEVVDFLRQCARNPRHAFDIGQAGRRPPPGPSRNAAAARVCGPRRRRRSRPADWRRWPCAALLAMAADGEAVRLVAQPLQVIENRAFVIEAERLPCPAGCRNAHGPRRGRGPWRCRPAPRLPRPDRRRPGRQWRVGPARRRSAPGRDVCALGVLVSSFISRAKRRVSTSRIMA